MKSIKSKYISEIIFSFICEITKLKLAKHNKRIQEFLNINIFNYRIYSRRYLVYETKDKAIEYYNDFKLKYKKFEGEYLNGKRNGKGKEYDNNGSVIYEGEYLNGKRHGKGKIYDSDGLCYEGELRYGKINGKGKLYYSGKLIFEGNFLNKNKFDGIGYDLNQNKLYELKDGKGYIKEYDCFGILEYEGEYLNGMRNGKGKIYNQYKEVIFEGEFLNGRPWTGKAYKDNDVIYEIKNGNGYCINYYYSNIIRSEYEYKNGQKNGYEKEYFLNGKLKFEGEYKNGLRNGKGKEYNYLNYQLQYEGEYLNGMKNGMAKEYCNGVVRFEGEYLYNYRRKGKLYINGLLEYEGEFLFDNKWNGKGYKNGNINYEIIKGNGYVKEYNSIGQLIFEGEYKNGERNGKGREYNRYYQIEFDGEYLNGKRWNGRIKEFDNNNNIIFLGEISNGMKVQNKDNI